MTRLTARRPLVVRGEASDRRVKVTVEASDIVFNFDRCFRLENSDFRSVFALLNCKNYAEPAKSELILAVKNG